MQSAMNMLISWSKNHILLAFLDDKNLYTYAWNELIFPSWYLYREDHSELLG